MTFPSDREGRMTGPAVTPGEGNPARIEGEITRTAHPAAFIGCRRHFHSEGALGT